MGKRKYILISVILIVCLFFGSAQSPPSTECTTGDTSACQEPFYTDDQNEYFYDQDASWVLEGGAPSDSGPSTFFGALSYDTGTEEIDSSSSGQLVEQFINSPGSAEGGSQNSFGRGTLEQRTISEITDQDVQTNSDGESYVVTPPNDGMCGDGKLQTGENRVNCPEDAGLPEVEIDSVPAPNDDISFDNTGTESRDWGEFSDASDIHIDSTYNGAEPDYVLSSDKEYVKEQTVDENYGVELISGTHHRLSSDTSNILNGYVGKPGTTDKDNYVGAETEEKTRCSEVTKQPKTVNRREDVTFTENTKSASGTKTVHESSGGSGPKASITYLSDFEISPNVWQCSNTKSWNECSDTRSNECNRSGSVTVLDESASTVNPDYAVREQSWKVTYDYYLLNDNKIWGPVNDKPGISGDTPFEDAIDHSRIKRDDPDGYHVYGQPTDSREASNDPAVSYTSFQLEVKSGSFWTDRTSSTVLNADGQDGRSNGIVAYNEDSDSIAGSSEGFMNSELVDGVVDTFLIESEVRNKISCPEDRCLAAVDITTERSGWDHPTTSPGTDSYTVSVNSINSVTESAGACETYKNLTGVSDEELDCSPGPNFDVCGEYTWEQKVHQVGNHVDGNVVPDNKAHYEACMDTRNQEGYCVLGNSSTGTELVKEGTVANILPFYHDNGSYHNGSYQAGDWKSPTRSVCLDRGSSTIQGEWHNLDDSHPAVNDYIDDTFSLDTDQRVGDTDYIDYYYGKNPNPQHPEYNPEGGNTGISLIADCGPLLNGCATSGNNIRREVNAGDGTYFAFFEEEHNGEPVRDNDYHPEGLNSTSYYVDPLFKGRINKVKKSQMGTDGYAEFNAHQLDPGHPDTSEVATEWYNDTTIGSDEAVQYAYTKYRNWSVDVTGVPYPPFNAENLGYSNIDDTGNHYKRSYTGQKRTSLDDETVPKTAKAFGNSIAVVAEQDISWGGVIGPAYEVEKGEGFWIDPDNIENHSKKGYINGINTDGEQWRDLLNWSIDITGPDQGIGYDLEHGKLNDTDPGYLDEARDTTGNGEDDTFFADIIWQRNSPLAQGLEPPTCGDDQREYLIREYKTADFTPEEISYACVNQSDPDVCVYEDDLYDEGTLLDVGENRTEAEEQGNSPDKEVCLNMRKDIGGGSWYDMDQWNATSYVREEIWNERGIQDSYSESDLEGVLASDQWIQMWRFHPDKKAVNDPGEYEEPNWYSEVNHAGPEAVPQILQNTTGGFAIEDNCQDSIDNNCQDLVDPVYDNRIWGNFSERGSRPDDYEDRTHDYYLDIVHNRMMIGGDLGVGASNEQEKETEQNFENEFHRSEINESFNQWAYTENLDHGVGPFGGIYDPGQCYGLDRNQGKDYNKTVRLFANSYASMIGSWVNPDENVNSSKKAGLTCDLTGYDWGYGFNTSGYHGGSYDCIQGDCSTSDFSSFSDPAVILGDIEFKDSSKIYPDACGDDPSEYLIREYNTNEFRSSKITYACTDNPNDCVYNEEIYSEGELVDIGEKRTEDGGHSPDKEVCLNIQEEIAGGSWYDVDDWRSTDHVREAILGNGGNKDGALASDKWQELWRVHPDQDAVTGSSGFEEPFWYSEVDHEGPIAVPKILKNDTGGFAIEDNCQEGLSTDCQDLTNPDYKNRIWGNFSEVVERGGRPDDYKDGSYPQSLNIFHNRMLIGGNTGIGSSNPQDQETERTSELEDNPFTTSKIQEEFNQWAYTENLDHGVGPFGGIYDPGQCYGLDRNQGKDYNKTVRLFANSYLDNGDWINPDNNVNSVVQGEFTCDLTGDDKGYGFNEGSYSDGNFDEEATAASGAKAIQGEIAYETSPKTYKKACGDDPSEYLIEEAGESPNSKRWTGRWACVDQKTKCVSWTRGSHQIYDERTYHNTEEPGETENRLKNDREYCQRRSGDWQGVWYDQDFTQKYCRENTLYGKPGVKWINYNYIDDHPQAVKGGIDDSWNPWMQQLGKNSLKSDKGGELNSSFSPIDSGTNYDKVAVPAPADEKYGFCGGDDEGERLVVQRCNTNACETDNSVIGVEVSSNKGSCILDHSAYPQVNGDEIELHQPGDTVEFDYGSSTTEASCFDGIWYDQWPVVWQKENIEVGKDNTVRATFQVINIRPERTEYNIELYGDDRANQFSQFTHTENNEFTVEVAGQSTKTFQVEIYGGNTNIDNEDLTLQGVEVDGEISGEDNLNIDIIEDSGTGTGTRKSTTRNVPGIQKHQIVVLLVVSTLIYFRKD